jgi:membrane-bound lytic murein transglycosylase D
MRIVDPEQPDTVVEARRYARDPARFAQMLARSEPFLWFIVEAVELREMPLEIALLPAVESGFDPHAHSPAQARGLWQFVPWTGRAMGLQQSRHYDARRDPVASTRAALAYLSRLHQRFGDWLLALAAYNVGDARLERAIRDQGTRVFWDLDLPAETRAHVPRLLGVALAVQHPERFGVALPALPNRQAAEFVMLEGPRDLERAAAAAGVAAESLERYNPGLLTARNSRGKHSVLLPPAEAARLRAALASGHYVPAPEPREQEHVVAPGDSLWTIARRYRVSVQQLARWNDLAPRAVLRPGRRLLILAT